MLARLLLIILFACPVIGGVGFGWALGAGYGLVFFAVGLFACAVIALTMDVYPEPVSREVSR